MLSTSSSPWADLGQVKFSCLTLVFWSVARMTLESSIILTLCLVDKKLRMRASGDYYSETSLGLGLCSAHCGLPETDSWLLLMVEVVRG